MTITDIHAATATATAAAAVDRAGVLQPRVSVIIPAMNEARNLPHVLAALPAGLHEVILVDGNSTDGTPAAARRLRPGIRVIGQTRKGKGNALACGFAAATGDIIVMIDADGSTDPAEIPAFVDALTSGADFAKGSRFAPGAGSADITPLRRLGNRILGLAVNTLYRTRYTDLCYGYNAFWATAVPAFGLRPDSTAKAWGDGFEIETLINLRAAAAGLNITEVPSYEHARIHGTSNLNTFRDGRRVLRTIITEWHRR
jgi:glycosyltransferase involved in cell wall biosynthesis